MKNFEEKLQRELNKLPYKEHLDDGGYNDGQINGFELGARWAFSQFEGNEDAVMPSICLQVGMRVKIRNDTKNFMFNAGKIKTITKQLADFGKLKAFELDGDEGIWCIEDFDFCVDYPNAVMY